MRYGLKERLAGFALMIVIVPLAVLGYLLIVYIGFLAKPSVIATLPDIAACS
jgi:hypothetical protein